jgi:hypothetical protein
VASTVSGRPRVKQGIHPSTTTRFGSMAVASFIADYMTSWGLLSMNNCGFKVLLKKENYNTIKFV